MVPTEEAAITERIVLGEMVSFIELRYEIVKQAKNYIRHY
jgi:hypothetical protein